VGSLSTLDASGAPTAQQVALWRHLKRVTSNIDGILKMLEWAGDVVTSNATARVSGWRGDEGSSEFAVH
jgi:hypothetical protein